MEINESNRMDQAESILDQLLDFTAQLAASENDPQLDAKALFNEFASRLDDLKRLMPEDLKRSAPGSPVLDKMRDLQARTQVCLGILERKSSQVAAKLETLSRTRHAASAYITRGYR